MSAPIAVSIAGSDPSGGAGIEADLKTFSALGVYGAAVITALTAQNTKGVFGIHDVPADFVAAQLNAVFTDLDLGAVKIGMLANAAAIDVVTAALDRYRPRNVVLDPVMVASSGEKLLRGDALGRLRELMTRVRVVTPNLPEAAALLETAPARDEDDMRAQAQKLLTLGAGAVLIKGGHGGGPGQRRSSGRAGRRLRAARGAARRDQEHPRHRLHIGLGASPPGWRKGFRWKRRRSEAKAYVSAAIAAADRLGVGSGRGPVHHFHAWW